MKVGITFDLRSMYLKFGYSEEETAEFDDEQTINAIEEQLQLMGFETERIGNVNELMEALMAGKRWDLVFNICEGLYGEGRESLVPALLDNYLIPYVFSGPVVLALSLNKHLCKMVVSNSGVNTPDGVLVRTVNDIDDIELQYPLFVKPVSEGTGKGITEKSLVHNVRELRETASYLLKRFSQNVLVEEYLPGREFTVGIVGNGESAEVVGVMEVVCKGSDSYGYKTKENYKILASYNRVSNIEYNKCSEIALKVWNVLGACDGGRVDLRVDKFGQINFMEINPLAGLNPVNSDLPILAAMQGIDYSELLNIIIDASLQRHGILQTKKSISMKSCVIVYNKPSEQAELDELDVLDQALFVKKNLGELGWNVSTLGLSDSFYQQLADFKNGKDTVFYNLAEAAYRKGELNYFIPAIMDSFNMVYTGNSTNSLFITTNKLLTKKMLSEAGIRTPEWHTLSDLSCLFEDKKYIIKPIKEDASLGIEENSIIDIDYIRKLSKSKLAKLRGSFIEEYIDGREFNVSLVSDNGEPSVLPVAEIDFVDFPQDKPKIVGYKAKWDESSFEYTNTVRTFNTLAEDESLKEELGTIAKQCWYLFDLKGYARVDFRVNNKGEIFVLEINANPCIASNSGFIAAVKEAGISFIELFDKIMCDLNNKENEI